MPEDWQQTGFGLYIHWPFCLSKCPYCDFNSHVVQNVQEPRWAAAFLAEITRIRDETGPRILRSVFFGGGTPSLMSPELVSTILQHVRETWAMANDAEITLEANPTSIEAGRFRGYHEAGVNRVSMGIQALNDTDLRALGRLHTAKEARAAYDIALAEFDRVNFDLIYARQNQSLDAWRGELKDALAIGSSHLSLYQLSIEHGTSFGDRFAAGRLSGLPTEDLSADMYELTQEMCERVGMPAYEISNHARTGQESLHNLIYWRCGDYAGIGPGAHGRLTFGGTRYATECYKNPEKWLSSIETTGSGISDRTSLTLHEQANEFLMMGLRLCKGVSLDRLKTLTGQRVNPKVISSLQDLGMISIESAQLCATKKGRCVLNAVLRELLLG